MRVVFYHPTNANTQATRIFMAKKFMRKQLIQLLQNHESAHSILIVHAQVMHLTFFFSPLVRFQLKWT